MKQNRTILFFFILSFSFNLHSTTRTVCASGCDHTTIVAAISAASSGDIIDIQDNTHTEQNIEIDKNLTIQGQGQTTTIVQAHAVQADAVDGVFKILDPGLIVTFQNMTIQNGNALGTMSSILDTGGGVHIFCNGSTNVTFENVTITNNKSQDDKGGGVYIRGDAGTVSFTNCVFSNNEAVGSDSDGGGLVNVGADNLTMTKCTISGNTAGDDGGAVYISEDGSTNRFINCTVFNNSGGGSSADQGRGGGFFLFGTSTFEFFNCTIVNNSLNTIATRQGGGIYHADVSTLSLTNTIIANNSGATTGHGNDVYTANGSSTFNQTTSLVMDCQEGGGTCPPFSYYGNPNLGSVQTCGVHSYFTATTTSFISDNGTNPSGNIPTDDICGTTRSAASNDIGSYDDVTISTGLVESTGDLEAYFSNNINYLPAADQNDYAEPSAGNLTTWGTIVDKLLADNTSGANTDALTIDYQVILFTDDGQTPNKLYYVLQRTAGSTNYWGTYIFNPASCREIIIQAPHPVHDSNTGNQGVYCLKNANARAFMMAGTHRCNHTDPTTCDGTSAVCTGNSSDMYKISDQAHNSNNCFQTTSDKLHDDLSTSVLIQLHGFTKQMGDPDVILSNGTTFNPSGTDYANDFKTHLAATDGSLTFEVAHIDNWTRLIGTTNTQGRYINGENVPCTNAASAATGRFVHLEQEPTKLRDNSTGWEKVSTAMENLISCSAAPIELTYFGGRLENENVVLTWETASEFNNEGFYIERKISVSEEWETLDFMNGKGTVSTPQNYSFTDFNPKKGINTYRLKQTDFDGGFEFSKIVNVNFQKDGHFKIKPNPVQNGTFSIEINDFDFESGELSIFDSVGRLVKIHSVSDLNKEVRIGKLPPGIYFVNLNFDGHRFFERILAE